jgi:formylglycine-generating enzyme required for sulfatase activity
MMIQWRRLGLRVQRWMALALLTVVGGTIGGRASSLSIRLVPELELTLQGATGSSNRVQYAESLASATVWQSLTNIVLTNASCVIRDPTGPSTQARFYRVLTLSSTDTNPPFATPKNLAWILAGTFQLGSPENDPDRSDLETPQSLVTLTHNFWIGKFEVTQEEYQSVTGGNPSGTTGNSKLPVDSVSWGDANQYCTLLTQREWQAGRLTNSYAYRLPTEAEWEYVARAGRTNRFSFGDDLDFTLIGQYAWTAENSGDDTHPTGRKTANAWGLYDLSGNVAEWCLDWFNLYTSDNKIDPTGPANGSDRVYRGGSWADPAANSRAAARGGLNPNTRLSSFGFRVVLAPTRP